MGELTRAEASGAIVRPTRSATRREPEYRAQDNHRAARFQPWQPKQINKADADDDN